MGIIKKAQLAGRGGLFPAEATIPLPPAHLRRAVGEEAVFHDVPLTTMGRMSMAGLRPTDDVLDIGCGVGRQARYLCDFLNPGARYEGFDISEPCIRWCQENISPRFPNFNFRHCPLRNTAYSPGRGAAAETFRFPYSDEVFDFAFAHSVFTHLTIDAMENYVAETSRVLRPGGTVYTTWFLFDGEGGYCHPLTLTMQRHPSGSFAVADPERPEAAIAFSEEVVRGVFERNGLSIVGAVHPGYSRLQDAIVATK